MYARQPRAAVANDAVAVGDGGLSVVVLCVCAFVFRWVQARDRLL